MNAVTTHLRLAIGAGVALLIPTVASTYTVLSPARHWTTTPVPICVVGPGHASIDDADQGITATIQALNGTHPRLAATGWNMTSLGPVINARTCTNTWQLGDGNPTIAFDEKIAGTCAGSCLAATFTGLYSCDTRFPDDHCVIQDSDVETRRNKQAKGGGPYYSLYESCTAGKEWSIEAIMVHETGHQLGIGHSSVVGSTMYPSVSSCNTGPATLSADDAAALDALY